MMRMEGQASRIETEAGRQHLHVGLGAEVEIAPVIVQVLFLPDFYGIERAAVPASQCPR